MSTRGWRGVDLDRTLAHYDQWIGPNMIGEPIMSMVNRVKQWLDEGMDVRIFTARAAHDEDGSATRAIHAWCHKHIGRALPVTATKDFYCESIWDDRAVTVEKNTGRILTRFTE